MRLNDIYATIQGEGCQTGVPMVVIRLQGCGVGCRWCDTKETWATNPLDSVIVLQDALGTNARWINASAETIAYRAREIAQGIQWALLTGGEPAEQELRELVEALHSRGFSVAIETSGTAMGHVGVGIDWVCVSPKFDQPGGREVLAEAFAEADEIKQVVAGQADIDRLEAFLRTTTPAPRCCISLQPVSQQPRATQLCVDTCIRRGWRLSLQVHRYAGVR